MIRTIVLLIKVNLIRSAILWGGVQPEFKSCEVVLPSPILNTFLTQMGGGVGEVDLILGVEAREAPGAT